MAPSKEDEGGGMGLFTTATAAETCSVSTILGRELETVSPKKRLIPRAGEERRDSTGVPFILLDLQTI